MVLYGKFELSNLRINVCIYISDFFLKFCKILFNQNLTVYNSFLVSLLNIYHSANS